MRSRALPDHEYGAARARSAREYDEEHKGQGRLHGGGIRLPPRARSAEAIEQGEGSKPKRCRGREDHTVEVAVQALDGQHGASPVELDPAKGLHPLGVGIGEHHVVDLVQVDRALVESQANLGLRPAEAGCPRNQEVEPLGKRSKGARWVGKHEPRGANGDRCANADGERHQRLLRRVGTIDAFACGVVAVLLRVGAKLTQRAVEVGSALALVSPTNTSGDGCILALEQLRRVWRESPVAVSKH
mmetsp:Transcript_43779/g.128936  ORF Transcript_43779/g.128936 Transcript_43779/m.128936 type:complete len:244 (+) Transcript_43779:686-1417(+)